MTEIKLLKPEGDIKGFSFDDQYENTKLQVDDFTIKLFEHMDKALGIIFPDSSVKSLITEFNKLTASLFLYSKGENFKNGEKEKDLDGIYAYRVLLKIGDEYANSEDFQEKLKKYSKVEIEKYKSGFVKVVLITKNLYNIMFEYLGLENVESEYSNMDVMRIIVNRLYEISQELKDKHGIEIKKFYEIPYFGTGGLPIKEEMNNILKEGGEDSKEMINEMENIYTILENIYTLYPIDLSDNGECGKNCDKEIGKYLIPNNNLEITISNL